MANEIVKVENEKLIVDFTDKESFGKKEKLYLKRLLSYGNILSDIKFEKLYKIVGSPEGSMIEYADGTCIPIFKGDDGKITGPAQMKEVSFDITQLVKGVATQSMLIRISCQLDEMNSRLDKIEKGLQNDRISSVEGVIKTCEDNEYNMQGNELVLASDLRQGVLSLEKYFSSYEIPNPRARFFENWFGKDKNLQCMECITELQNCMYWIIRGYGAIFRLYENYNITHHMQFENTKNLTNLFDGMYEFLNSIKYDELISCSRTLPYDPNSVPEMVWNDLSSCSKKIPKISNEYIKMMKCDSFELQFNSNLLEEVQNEL